MIKPMKKEEFREKVITPLTDAFGFRVYFNGKESEKVGLRLGNKYGRSFTSRKDAPIIITWRRDFYSTAKTTFHEFAHSILHRKGTMGKHAIGNWVKEVEAESVAKRVMELLDLPYPLWDKNNPNLEYIQYHWDKYMRYCDRTDRESKQPRYDLIEETAQKIAEVMQKERIIS